MTIQVGQRVQTPLGFATVLGFESFYDQGRRASLVSTENGGRVLCRLDDPNMWHGATELHPDPYMFRSDLSELGEN